MNEVLVIGLGNPDCGDDGAGPLAVSMTVSLLGEHVPPNVRTLIRSGDTLALLEDWAQYDTCIVVDAAVGESQAGTIHRLDLAHDVLPHDLSLSSTHAFGLAEAIALARTLGQLPQGLIVYAVEGECFTCGDTMTSAVYAAASQVAQRIVAELVPRQVVGEPSYA